jgi:L,D-peptidoglycan transpeptidase YkuD (ErfK/YbiS/YcfS/YnhG family)
MRGLVCACAVGVVVASAAPAQAAPEVTPAGMRGLGGAERVIVVAATGLKTTHATARTYEREGETWRRVRRAMPARLGHAGLRSAARRREGDGTTPVGTYRFVYGFGSQADPGVTGLRWRRLTPSSCWSALRSSYNRWIDRRPCPGEDLWSYRHRHYRYAAVIDFNYRRPVVGRGSGIFLHVGTGGPTLGCVSLRERDLLPVLRWLRPDTRIVIGTVGRLRALKR